MKKKKTTKKIDGNTFIVRTLTPESKKIRAFSKRHGNLKFNFIFRMLIRHLDEIKSIEVLTSCQEK